MHPEVIVIVGVLKVVNVLYVKQCFGNIFIKLNFYRYLYNVRQGLPAKRINFTLQKERKKESNHDSEKIDWLLISRFKMIKKATLRCNIQGVITATSSLEFYCAMCQCGF